jgi:hypothetical protein
MLPFVTEPARRPANYDDLVALGDGVIGEIIAGELHASPRPAGRHAVAGAALGGTLVPPFHFGDGGPGGWWILFEPEIHLGNDVLVPDFGGWRRERMPNPPQDAFIDLRPDWVCEILSPSTARLDRIRKLPAYAAASVPHVWLIDPAAKTLEVLRLESGRWLVVGLHAGDDVVRAEPFDAIEVRLGRLWG